MFSTSYTLRRRSVGLNWLLKLLKLLFDALLDVVAAAAALITAGLFVFVHVLLVLNDPELNGDELAAADVFVVEADAGNEGDGALP